MQNSFRSLSFFVNNMENFLRLTTEHFRLTDDDFRGAVCFPVVVSSLRVIFHYLLIFFILLQAVIYLFIDQ